MIVGSLLQVCFLRKSSLLPAISLPMHWLQAEPSSQLPRPRGSNSKSLGLFLVKVARASRHRKQVHRQRPCFLETSTIPKHGGVRIGSAASTALLGRLALGGWMRRRDHLR